MKVITPWKGVTGTLHTAPLRNHNLVIMSYTALPS